MAEQSHRSDPGVLNQRTLERDHRVLAGMLRPGMTVLDVGCGTGAITAGIAAAVGPTGRVVGVDRDPALLDLAGSSVPWLRFERGDALALPYENEFDIATAARVLQWIGDPARAVRQMGRAVKSGGVIVVLDYSHACNTWTPDPPLEFARFYAHFLGWREANGWDNALADRLPEMFQAAGLVDVASFPSDETNAAVWESVIETIGPGFCDSGELVRAAERYRWYCRNVLERHTLSLRTVTGRKP